jgi:hypothetical protein
MLVRQVAIVPERKTVARDELSAITAAIQKQVSRDFAPVWEIQATVDWFASLEEVPLGYWPIIVTERDMGNDEGVHLDGNGQPYALVEHSETWSIAASHECLELLADPSCNRLVAGPSPIDEDHSRVEFLVEVCDPCQAGEIAYTVNGIPVSDFHTPRYYDPSPTTGAQYSFTGKITAPRQVLEGGYLSWRDPVRREWFQRHVVGGKPIDRSLGALEPNGLGLRRAVNAVTPNHRDATRLPKKSRAHRQLAAIRHANARSSKERAATLRGELARLFERSSP